MINEKETKQKSFQKLLQGRPKMIRLTDFAIAYLTSEENQDLIKLRDFKDFKEKLIKEPTLQLFESELYQLCMLRIFEIQMATKRVSSDQVSKYTDLTVIFNKLNKKEIN